MLLSVDRSEGSDVPVSFAIVEAVADQEGIDPTDIEPPEYEALYDVCNPEALDALFATGQHSGRTSDITVTFEFCGYDIRVTGHDRVSVLDESDDG